MKAKRTLRTLQDDVAAWAEAQFPGQTILGKINHLRREVDELYHAVVKAAVETGAAPKNVHMELADCQNLLIHIVKLAGISAESHVENCYTKLDICKRRAWPAQPDSEGVYQHIETPAAACSHRREEVAI